MLSNVLQLRTRSFNPTPSVAPDTRIYAIGDVHGRHDLLLTLLTKINRDASSRADDRAVSLVFLGNYIDLGDGSAQVLEVLEELVTSTEGRVLCLKGNHEAALLRFLKDPLGGRIWLENGAVETLASFGLAPLEPHAPQSKMFGLAHKLEVLLGSRLAFLRDMPLHYRSGEVIFTHAGVNPHSKVVTEDEQAILRGHTGFLVPDPVPGLRFVHGHYDHLVPVLHPGRICIDTGAYYSGVLTAVRLDAEIGFLTADTASLPL